MQKRRRFGFPVTFQKTSWHISNVDEGQNTLMPCREKLCPDYTVKSEFYKLYTHTENFLLYSEHISDESCPKQKDPKLLKFLQQRKAAQPKWAIDAELQTQAYVPGQASPFLTYD